MKHVLSALAFAALAATPALAQEPGATARMIDANGEEVGTVAFQTTESGQLHLFVEMSGLAAGAHGFHVHETGACEPEGGFETAGGHYAGEMEHGVMAEGGPHPGDLPNVHVGQDGVLKVEFFTDDLSIDEEGENTLFDEDGSAVVIHADPDDYSSQPSGEAGDRLACGVIEKAG